MLVVALWVAVALAFGFYSDYDSLIPGRIPIWRHILYTFVGLAPMAILPATLATVSVVGRAPMRHIPSLAIGGAIVGLPITFVTAVVSACYIAFYCL